MKFGFGKKRTIADIEREAQAELDEAMSRARPPTDAERTWVLPAPDVPDLFAQSRVRRPPRRLPEQEDLEEMRPPAAPRARKAASPPRKSQPVSRSKSPTKKAPTPRRSTDEESGLA